MLPAPNLNDEAAAQNGHYAHRARLSRIPFVQFLNSEMPAAKLGSRTAGEGSGHTARMHVSEESDSGVVPMNHSNKDGKPPAENEEGRLLIRENTLPSGAYPTLSGSARVPRVGECADKLYAWPLFIRDKSRMR